MSIEHSLFSNSPQYTLFAPQILHKLLFSNALGDTAYSEEHLKTMVYAKFGGQTKCIMGNSKIENYASIIVRKIPGNMSKYRNKEINTSELGTIFEIEIPDFLWRNIHDNQLPQTSPQETDVAT